MNTPKPGDFYKEFETGRIVTVIGVIERGVVFAFNEGEDSDMTFGMSLSNFLKKFDPISW
jgi:hypothetical protein